MTGCSAKACFSIAACTSGRAIAATNSLLTRSTTSRGILAGPNSPAHEVIENCGMPASAMVGTSGSRWLRLPSVVTSGRSLPSRICGTEVPEEQNMSCTRPATRSVTACGSPLYGTCTIWILASEAKYAVETMPVVLPVA